MFLPKCTDCNVTCNVIYRYVDDRLFIYKHWSTEAGYKIVNQRLDSQCFVAAISAEVLMFPK